MKFLADENIDKAIVERLRENNHIVIYVLEIGPSISDEEVIQQANQERAILLTADKDFGELVFRQKRILTGVILIRLAGLSAQHKAEIVTTTIREHTNEIAQAFTVIAFGTVRIRKLMPAADTQ